MEGTVLRSKAPPVPKDNNIVKIAVEMANRQPQLIEFNQKQPLLNIIQDLCSYWNLSEPESYALRFNMEANKAFVCDKNRMEVKNGFVLLLGLSAAKIVQLILKQLAQGSSQDEKLKGLQELSTYCNDATFAAEFVDKQGMEVLIHHVETMEGGKVSDQIIAQLLPAFVDLMDHGLSQWDILEPAFVKKVASLINNQSTASDPRTLQAALSILESLVLNSAKSLTVERELTLPNLAMHLQNNSAAIQQNALALINALFLKADDAKRTAIAATLNTRQIRNTIVMNIIQGIIFHFFFHRHSNDGADCIFSIFIGQTVPLTASGNEMAHQLHVLQTLMLNVLEDRMNRPVEPNDTDALEKVKELRRIAFDNDGSSSGDLQGNNRDHVTTRKAQTSPRDYRKLGFKNDSTPLNDFGMKC